MVKSSPILITIPGANRLMDIKDLKLRAEQGEPKAQIRLGEKYYFGESMTKDYAQATHWFRKAAEQGDAEGQFNLGWMYFNGKGLAEDDAQAVHWFRKAAEQGHVEAQCNLGAYYLGKGCEQDYAQAAHCFPQAAHWFHKAAEQGDAAAQFSLGMMYRGYMAESENNKNDEQAAYWCLKAAEQNHAEAQDNLGSIYEEEGEYIAAHKWYSVVAAQGNDDRREYLGLLEESMSHDEIVEAKKQADQWLRAHQNIIKQES
ncbi:MAG: tetratricopeptide repeat protein [Gammaproteobacteria bacterium]|nr:tetratricopeptide repeat protein [Gammaproteobacteria bacterium]